MTTEDLSPAEADRLELLDRIAERIPWLDLDQESIEWTTLDGGHEALLVNGGGSMGVRAACLSMPGTTCTRSAAWPRSPTMWAAS